MTDDEAKRVFEMYAQDPERLYEAGRVLNAELERREEFAARQQGRIAELETFLRRAACDAAEACNAGPEAMEKVATTLWDMVEGKHVPASRCRHGVAQSRLICLACESL